MTTAPLAFLRRVLDVFSNVPEESTASILRVTELRQQFGRNFERHPPPDVETHKNAIN
jgi:hypothetical protein